MKALTGGVESESSNHAHGTTPANIAIRALPSRAKKMGAVSKTTAGAQEIEAIAASKNTTEPCLQQNNRKSKASIRSSNESPSNLMARCRATHANDGLAFRDRVNVFVLDRVAIRVTLVAMLPNLRSKPRPSKRKQELRRNPLKQHETCSQRNNTREIERKTVIHAFQLHNQQMRLPPSSRSKQ